MTCQVDIGQQRCCENPLTYKPDVKPFSVGLWQIDPSAREARTDTARRRLSPRALAVLVLLEGAKGDTVSRSALLNAVWPDVAVSEESLTQAVGELRRVLEQGPGGRHLVETVPKSGYRLARHAFADRPAEANGDLADHAHSLEAHLMMIEAGRLAIETGYAAADQIDELIDAAYAITPDDPAISVKFAVLKALAAQHCGTQADHLAVATEAVNATILRHPRCAAAFAAAGFAAAASGQVSAAGSHFSRALSLDPSDAETHYLGAQAYFAHGDLGAALTLSEKASRLDPLDYRPTFIAARAALALGEADRASMFGTAALQRVEARLSEDPTCPRWLAARAALRAMLGKARSDEDLQIDGPPYFYDLIAASETEDPQQALDALEMLLDNGWRNGNWLRADPVSFRFSNEPRFARLMEHLEAA